MGAQVHTGGAVGNTVVATAGVGRALDLCNNDSDIAVTVRRAPRVLGPARTPRLLAGVSQAGGRAGTGTCPAGRRSRHIFLVQLLMLFHCRFCGVVRTSIKAVTTACLSPCTTPTGRGWGAGLLARRGRPSWGSPFRVLVTVCHSCAQRVCVTLACSLAGVAVPIATS